MTTIFFSTQNLFFLTRTATDYIPVCEDDQGIKVSNHSSKSKNKDDFTYIPMFSASTLSNAGKQGVNSHILNAGSSIWGLDFAPSLHTDTQYLAVAGYKSTTERHVLGVRQVEEEDDDPNMKGCIQIWSLPNCVDKVDNSRGQKSARRSSSSSSVNDQQEDKNEEEMDEGMDVDQQVAQLEVCILHEFGCVYDIKWCPYGGYESEEEVNESCRVLDFYF